MNREVKIFISYNRHSEAITKTLADDIKLLGYRVWFDQELRGGQTWWDEILAKIRECDVFILMLDSMTLNSTACKHEYSYAANLGKPILPILIARDISPNLLPPALSQIQFVDYREQDRAAVLHLARALINVPPPKPLPDPLPPLPEVPISYLGRLAEQIETSSFLDYEKQSTLVINLKKSLHDPEIAKEVPTLLRRLRKRLDLFAPIAEEIDELLQSIGKAPSVPPHISQPELPSQESFPKILHNQQPEKKTQIAPIRKSEIRKWAVIGGLLGGFFGIFLISIIFTRYTLGTGLFCGIPIGSVLGLIALIIRQAIRHHRSNDNQQPQAKT